MIVEINGQTIDHSQEDWGWVDSGPLIDARLVIKHVRDIAEAFPKDFYVKDAVCRYMSGVCTNNTCGCLIGQAMLLAGFPPEALLAIDGRTPQPPGGLSGSTPEISDLFDLDWFLQPGGSFASDWLGHVQRSQDAGAEWGDCIRNADQRLAWKVLELQEIE